jgi:hypothetical protein
VKRSTSTGPCERRTLERRCDARACQAAGLASNRCHDASICTDRQRDVHARCGLRRFTTRGHLRLDSLDTRSGRRAVETRGFAREPLALEALSGRTRLGVLALPRPLGGRVDLGLIVRVGCARPAAEQEFAEDSTVGSAVKTSVESPTVESSATEAARGDHENDGQQRRLDHLDIVEPADPAIGAFTRCSRGIVGRQTLA